MDDEIRNTLASLRALRRQAGELAMADGVAACNTAIATAEKFLPAPTLPVVTKQVIDKSNLHVVSLQYSGDRYRRFGTDLILTDTAIAQVFFCTDQAAGGDHKPLPFVRYAWEIAVIGQDGTVGPWRERAVYARSSLVSPQGVLVGALTDEPDGPALSRIAGYDANDVRGPDAQFPVYGIYIDRTGAAKDHPYYINQFESFEWSHVSGGTAPHMWAILAHANCRDSARPFVERAAVPFNTPLAYTQITSIPISAPADLRTTPRRRSLLKSGLRVTSAPQGYEWQDATRPDWTHQPRYAGPRGINTTPHTLALYVGRRFKRYATSPRALWAIDSVGTARCLFGEDWPLDYPPNLSELKGPKPDTRIRYQGVPKPGFVLPAGIEPCPQECWSITVDERSTVTDPNATPIGGEQPHPGNVIILVPDSRGFVWKLEFNGHDRSAPCWYSILCTCNDPWTVRARAGVAFVTERTGSQVTMYSIDTGAKLGVLLDADPNAASLGQLSGRSFTFNAGKTRAYARTLTGCPWPEGMWIDNDYLVVGSFCLAEVRRWPISFNPDGTAQITGAMQVCFRPFIDGKSKYVLLEMNRTPDEPFGPDGWISVATWTNGNPAKGRPDIYIPSPGNDADGTPLQMTKRWGPFGQPVGFLPNGRNGTEGASYAEAMSCAHGRFECSSAEDGIHALMQAEAVDGPLLTAAEIAALQDGGRWYDENYNVACGDYGYGEHPLPWGVYANCDAWLQYIGHINPDKP